MTEGYSGADLRVACKEAAFMPLRRALEVKDPQQLENGE